ncbi:polysaccharide biosynthesis/export family protein [Ekhidna sp.]|uniref:polysaccharide biosynthesis/export family protein n=1 Tax=Ekhidna sp. TaxID=2608089 RepID=UPI003B50B6BC
MNRLILLVSIAVLSSCKAYKQDIMFRLDDDFSEEDLSTITEEIESNYMLKPNDALLLDVFTNNGERLIDPNQEMMANPGQQQQQFRDRFQYIIQVDGTVTFPMIGDMNLEGMTLFEAELAIAEKFDSVYKGSFIKLRINNRRVFVLGSPGGVVIPIPNENTSLIEILSAAGGLDLGDKAQNIKLIRGKDVFRIDLSTISGMRESNLNVIPGDVIYVEPWRRPWLLTLKDVTPVLSLVTSILTLILVAQNI